MTSTGRDDNMIRECNKPGCIKYFADDDLCPACNDEGKFIMRGNERDSLARRLALAKACSENLIWRWISTAG